MANTRGGTFRTLSPLTDTVAADVFSGDDHTPIGHVGDRLKVDAALSVQNVDIDILGDEANLDTTGTDDHEVFAIGLPGAGGHVVGGTATNPLRTDPTGSTTQPVSAASLPLPSGAATEATLDKIATDITAVLAAIDKVITFTWLSFGSAHERIGTKVYTSASLSATVTDTYGYSEPLGSGNGFQLDTTTRVLT